MHGGRHQLKVKTVPITGMPKKSSDSPPEVVRPRDYATRLAQVLAAQDWSAVDDLVRLVREVWNNDRCVFVCGNGGSAANALHWANDFVYPIAKNHGRGVRISALTANTAILTCLANDLSYSQIFAHQLSVLARPGDLLIVLSGSGNSQNIIEAIATARQIGLRTAGVFGFDGGAAHSKVDVCVHIPVDDMQIAEDLQLVVNHMVMRQLALEAAGSD